MPLGQVSGQRILRDLAEPLGRAVVVGMSLADDDIGSSSPALAYASSKHETQYTQTGIKEAAARKQKQRNRKSKPTAYEISVYRVQTRSWETADVYAAEDHKVDSAPQCFGCVLFVPAPALPERNP